MKGSVTSETSRPDRRPFSIGVGDDIHKPPRGVGTRLISRCAGRLDYRSAATGTVGLELGVVCSRDKRTTVSITA